MNIDAMGYVVIAILVFVVIVMFKGIKTVPQGMEYTIERLRKYTRTLRPGLNLIVPFIDGVGHKINMR